MSKYLNLSERIVLELLKSGLWGIEPKVDSHIKIEDRRWEEIYSISATQGVLAIVFEGVLKLPEAQYPPAELLLRWSVNVKLVEKRYNFSKDAVLALNNIFANKNVEMLLLKGMSLAAYYPKPAHRESGDIDIYLLGKRQDMDYCMEQLFSASTKPVRQGSKHCTFYFKHIPVEYHVNFLNINRFQTFFDKRQNKRERRVEADLLNLLQAENKRWMKNSEDCKIRVASPTFNYLFLTCHTATHLPRGIVLRHLCDWACFLYHNKGRYDEKHIEDVFRHSRFNQVATLLTELVIHYLGLPDQYSPGSYKPTKKRALERKIILNILRPFTSCTSNNRYARAVWSIKRFFIEHWKYRLIYGDTLCERAFRVLHWWIDKKSMLINR